MSAAVLRSSAKSPGARALVTPMSSKSILKRPAPLPLSPKQPLSFAATFSLMVSSPSKNSSRVHFPASPAMVATFSAFSPNSYDRGASPPVPLSSGQIISPSFANFKLAAPPPKRRMATANALAPPAPFEVPRSPKPYKACASVARDSLAPPPFEDPRSPKPYKARSSTPGEQRASVCPAVVNKNLLAPPPFEDPRSPKPYRPISGMRLEDLVLYVPRGGHAVEGLGKALTVYPRSPYPSAPIANEEDDSNSSDLVSSPRARLAKGHIRARSLDVKSKRRHTSILGPATTKPVEFLSPVKESPGPAIAAPAKPTPLDLESESRLNKAFWQAVTLEAETPTSASATTGNGFGSILFGNQDGTLWSPRPRKHDGPNPRREPASMLSPGVFRRGVVASPSPSDPFAAFPSFSVAMMGLDGVISCPPRAHVAV